MYLLHTPASDILGNSDLLEALHKEKDEGTIRAFGLSLYGVDFFSDSIRQWQPDVVQIHFNLLNQGSSAVFGEAVAAGVVHWTQGCLEVIHWR